MQDMRSTAQEAAEDIFFGQAVLIWARWFVIVAGIIIALWGGQTQTVLTLSTIPFIALMVLNFFLRARYLANQPANQLLLFVTSLLDLIVITLVIFFSPENKGLASPFFVLYYPMLLAFAFVMPPRFTLVYTLLALFLYIGASAIAGLSSQTSFLTLQGQQDLFRRVVTLGAMSGLGAYYWRIQRARRRAAMGESPDR